MKILELTEEIVNQKLAELKTTMLSGTKTIEGKLTFDLGLGKAKDQHRPQILFDYEAYHKMRQLVQQCPKEIGWHGTVHRDGLTFTITDILVFPQVVTAATVNPDDELYTLWAMEQPEEIFNHMRFHGHSHVNMGCTPSAVDTTYQEALIQNVKDFYIVGIFNKRDEFNIWIYDVENNICYDKTDIDFLTPTENGAVWAKTMIAEYVTEPAKPLRVPPVTSIAPSYGTANNYQTPGERWQRGQLTEDEKDDYYDRLYGYGNRGNSGFFEHSQTTTRRGSGRPTQEETAENKEIMASFNSMPKAQQKVFRAKAKKLNRTLLQYLKLSALEVEELEKIYL